MDLETLAIRFSTEGEAGVRAAILGIAQQIDQLSGSVEGQLSNGIDHVIERIAEMISVWEGAELFKHMIEESAELAVKLEVFSQQTGIASDRLAEIGEQAELSFVPTDSLRSAFLRLGMSMGDSQSRGAQAMKAMGLDVNSFHGDAEQAFTAIAEKFADYRDDLNKSALQTALFGRGGQMTPLLNNFKETHKAVQEMGTAMTTEQQTTMLEYERAMIRLKLHADAFGRSVASEAAPALTALAQAFTVNVQKGDEFNAVAELLTGTIRFLGTIVIVVKTAFLAMGHAIGNLAAMVVKDAIPSFKTFGSILADIFTGNWAKFAIDVQTQLDRVKSGFAQLNHDLLVDGSTMADELKNLYGFGPEAAGGKRPPGTKDAPQVRTPTPTEPGKLLKDFLEEQKAEIEAMKAKYELQVHLEQQSVDSEAEKYAKIRKMDEEYLLQVGSIYGFESAEYYNQLKAMEEHTDQHNKVLLEMQKQQAKEWLKIEEDKTKQVEKLQQYQKEVARGIVRDMAQVIENTFRAGLEKGGGLGAAMKAFGDTILQGLGGILVQLGETYIEYGGIMQALATLLPNPFTAGAAGLAIGAALVALGSALGAVASGGSAGGGYGSGPHGPAGAINFTSAIAMGPNGAQQAGNVTPQQPVNVTIIGPRDPTAQRAILELLDNAGRR